MSDKPIIIDIPEGATPREEAAIVAGDPRFQALVEESRRQIAAGEGISLEDLEREAEDHENLARLSVALAAATLAALVAKAAAGARVTITSEGGEEVALIAQRELEDLRSRAALSRTAH